MSRRIRLRQLQRVYDQIPDVQCKGLCQAFCGVIAMSALEAERIEERTGQPLKVVDEKLRCAYLTAEGRCSVYDVRPFICRLWGAEEKLLCPHGCHPSNDRILRTGAARALQDQIDEISEHRYATTYGERYEDPSAG